jgi:hypothetical protein
MELRSETMKFRKVYVQREQWAVVFIATDDNITDSDIANFPNIIAERCKKQVDDDSIWTSNGFDVDMVSDADTHELRDCDYVSFDLSIEK